MFFEKIEAHTVTFYGDPILSILKDNSFRLEKPFNVWVDDEFISVPETFDTDLASVPRVPVIYYWLGSRGHKSAILHDWMYRCNMFPRKVCDDIFYWGLRADGMSHFEAWSMWKGVRLGAERPYIAYGMALQEKIDNAMKTNEALKTVEVEDRVWQ